MSLFQTKYNKFVKKLKKRGSGKTIKTGPSKKLGGKLISVHKQLQFQVKAVSQSKTQPVPQTVDQASSGMT